MLTEIKLTTLALLFLTTTLVYADHPNCTTYFTVRNSVPEKFNLTNCYKNFVAKAPITGFSLTWLPSNPLINFKSLSASSIILKYNGSAIQPGSYRLNLTMLNSLNQSYPVQFTFHILQ